MKIRPNFPCGPSARTLFTALLGAGAALLALIATPAQGDTFGSGSNTFSISFVLIGNAGNAADTTGYGAVSYNYNMSTYAVSQADMDLAVANGFTNGTAGKWTGSQPATKITWYQAAAFVNWLNTSQGYAPAYNLDPGATTLTPWSQSQAFSLGGGVYDLYRNASAHYFLPSENEYYKAAYYDPNKAGGAGYWQYATGSNTAPTPVASGTAPGTAVYGQPPPEPAGVDNAGGLSPYGTMAQNGNGDEWLESAYSGGYDPAEDRAIRGGRVGVDASFLQSSYRNDVTPSDSTNYIGFRVASIASVPEPSCAMLMIGSGLVFLSRRRRAQSL